MNLVPYIIASNDAGGQGSFPLTQSLPQKAIRHDTFKVSTNKFIFFLIHFFPPPLCVLSLISSSSPSLENPFFRHAFFTLSYYLLLIIKLQVTLTIRHDPRYVVVVVVPNSPIYSKQHGNNYITSGYSSKGTATSYQIFFVAEKPRFHRR
jgi:hypothetical protein